MRPVESSCFGHFDLIDEVSLLLWLFSPKTCLLRLSTSTLPHFHACLIFYIWSSPSLLSPDFTLLSSPWSIHTSSIFPYFWEERNATNNKSGKCNWKKNMTKILCKWKWIQTFKKKWHDIKNCFIRMISHHTVDSFSRVCLNYEKMFLAWVHVYWKQNWPPKICYQCKMLPLSEKKRCMCAGN